VTFSSQEKPNIIAALRKIPMFSGYSDEELLYITTRSEEIRLPAGTVLLYEDLPVDTLFVLLEGEVRGRRESGGADGSGYMWRTGEVLGILVFSQMNFPVTARLTAPGWILRISRAHFEELFQRLPTLIPRLIETVTSRIREFSRGDQYRDKLSALGKLSAGLAHELNNPASAAQRAAEGLRDSMRELREVNRTLADEVLSREQRDLIAVFEDNLLNQAASVSALVSLEQSDLEHELEAWLNGHGISSQAGLAAGFAEAGIDCTALDRLGERFRGEVLSRLLSRVVSSAVAERLTREIETSMERISELIRAVKEYSYMDRTLEQEVDVHQGIENTLTILKFRLKRGIEVKREFDPSLPRVFAHGSELNQVWTNLIENAIDAMGGTGELKIRTFRELDFVVVEIIDNGPGIADNVKPHIFEPFFTTKRVGKGMGIGLDIVYRIVNGHCGHVWFDSRSGRTSFQVRLSIKPARLRASVSPLSSTNTALSLTTRQELLIRQSLETLAEFSDSVLLLFYDRLFELDPGARQLFRIPIERQAQKLMSMLATIVEMLDRFDELRPQLKELGRGHVSYGVYPAQYRTLKEALLWAMAQVLKSEFDSETRAAWDKLLTTVSEAMISVD
jgi:signal transduction histidine kinase/hemoglobin-like flavoprotein